MASSRVSVSQDSPPREDRVRVLVVDDEAYITDLVATALRYEGFEAVAAGSGREALSLVESFRPQLIVLDVMLPDLDGFEVQRKLVDRGRRLPVLFLTGHFDQRLANDCAAKRIPVHRVPIESQALFRELRLALDDPRLGRS